MLRHADLVACRLAPVLGAQASPRMAPKINQRPLLTAAMVLAVAGFAPAGCLFGLGIGLALTLANDAVLGSTADARHIDPDHIAQVTVDFTHAMTTGLWITAAVTAATAVAALAQPAQRQAADPNGHVVLHVPGQAIDLVDDDRIDVTVLGNAGQDRLQCWPVRAASRLTSVDVLVGQQPRRGTRPHGRRGVVGSVRPDATGRAGSSGAGRYCDPRRTSSAPGWW